MRQLLICSGVDGQTNSLAWLQKVAKQKCPDGILFAGGVLSPTRKYAARITPWDLTREDGIFLERFLETMGNLNIFTAIIPGTMDTPLCEFLRLGMAAELEFPTLHLVHATLVTHAYFAFCGIGAGLSEEGARDTDCYSRTQAEYFLRSLWNVEQSNRILLFASPPPGPLGGSQAVPLVGDLIDSIHPSLCVVSGPTKCQGIGWIGHTRVINPGLLSDGAAAWLNLNKEEAEQVEFLVRNGEVKPRREIVPLGKSST